MTRNCSWTKCVQACGAFLRGPLLVLGLIVLGGAAPAIAQDVQRSNHDSRDRHDRQNEGSYDDGYDQSYDDQDSDSEEYQFNPRYDADDRDDGQQQDFRSGDRGGNAHHAHHHQPVERPQLGLRLNETDRDEVFVEDVLRGSPADRAGLRPGDIVLAINGFEVGSLDHVADSLRRHDARREVELIVERDGQTREVDIRLSSGWTHPAEAIASAVDEFANDAVQAAGTIGGNLQELGERMRQSTRNDGPRPHASRRDRYDRFSYDAEGEQTDIDDETSDYSGNAADVVEIDIFAPDSHGSAGQRNPAAQNQRGDRGQNYGGAHNRGGTQGNGNRYQQSAHERNQAGQNNSRGAADQSGHHAALGVALGHDTGPGVLVLGVHPGGPADDAGLLAGDRILEIDGHAVTGPDQLVHYLDTRHPGQDVEAMIARHGQRRNFLVMLGERSELARSPVIPQPGHHWANGRPNRDSRSSGQQQNQRDFD